MYLPNGDRPPVYRKKRQKMKIGLKYASIATLIAFLTLELVGQINFLPFGIEDNGPTAVVAGKQTAEIEAADFHCQAAVTSAFVSQGYDPGWHIPGLQFATFSNQGIRMQIVGDYDVCVWAKDTKIEVNDGVLSVTIDKIDARRPRVDHEPRRVAGKDVQTAVLVVATHFTKLNKDEGATDLQQSVLRFSQSVLDEGVCKEDAFQFVVERLRLHYTQEAVLHGLKLNLNIVPNSIDYGSFDFQEDGYSYEILESEECHVQSTWGATRS